MRALPIGCGQLMDASSILRGLSILFIAHDLSLAHYISERAVILCCGCVAEMGATDKIFDNPLYPYTKMLISSVPRLDKKWETGKVELKAKNSAYSDGRVYYDRCPVADQGCAKFAPPIVEIESDHYVACYRYIFAKWVQKSALFAD